tara:strand:+ start:215 stop:490 length:276 start_codon:yes stop_codon:yes gene_type:complete
MIPAVLISTLLPKLLKLVLPKVIEELGDVIKYVREDNVLDKELKKIKKDIRQLKQNSHEPKDFLEKCTAMEVQINRLQEDVDTIIKGGDIK